MKSMPFPNLVFRVSVVLLCVLFASDVQAQLLRQVFRPKVVAGQCIPGSPDCQSYQTYEIFPATEVVYPEQIISERVISSVPVQLTPTVPAPVQIQSLPVAESQPVEPVPLMLSDAPAMGRTNAKLMYRVKMFRALWKLKRTSPEARMALENPELFDFLCEQQSVPGVYGGPLLDWIISDPEAFIAFLKQIIELFMVKARYGVPTQMICYASFPSYDLAA